MENKTKQNKTAILYKPAVFANFTTFQCFAGDSPMLLSSRLVVLAQSISYGDAASAVTPLVQPSPLPAVHRSSRAARYPRVSRKLRYVRSLAWHAPFILWRRSLSPRGYVTGSAVMSHKTCVSVIIRCEQPSAVPRVPLRQYHTTQLILSSYALTTT